MERKKEFYPLYSARDNSQYPMYVEIAVENYYYAKDAYQKLKGGTLNCAEAMETGWTLDKFAVISVISSAAAVEAFLNDYAAACIGDEEFYDNFDKLTVLSKLQLIAQFIMGTTADKGGSLYSHLKALEKCRNRLIHSKSSNACGKVVTYTYDEYQEMLRAPKRLSDKIDLAPNKEMLDAARDGIKTLKELGMFFDSNDKSAYAIARLFMFDSRQLILEPDHPLVQVLREFHIPNSVAQ